MRLRNTCFSIITFKIHTSSIRTTLYVNFSLFEILLEVAFCQPFMMRVAFFPPLQWTKILLL